MTKGNSRADEQIVAYNMFKKPVRLNLWLVYFCFRVHFFVQETKEFTIPFQFEKGNIVGPLIHKKYITLFVCVV